MGQLECDGAILFYLRLALCILIVSILTCTMAQIFYTVPGVHQPDEVDFNTLFQPLTVGNIGNDVQDNSIIVDEGDVFQCGKCLDKFSFSDFVLHKKRNCQGINNIVIGNAQSFNLVAPPPMLDNPIVLDETNLINIMPNNDLSVVQNVIDPSVIQNDINLDCKNYQNEIPNIGYLQVDYNLRNEHNQCILEENGDIDCLNNPFDKESETNVQKDVKPDKTENDKLKCSFCDKVFRKNCMLEQHMRSHTGERPFLCVICGRAFSQKSNVIKHMSTHKVWPKKQCSLPKFHVHVNSNETSVTAYQVAGDKTFIAFDKSFFCQYCPSAFNKYTDWQLHMKCHVNVKVYKCIQNACDSTFSDLDRFLDHTRTHWGMAQYKCHICQQEFQSLDDLGQHQISHNTEPKKTVKNSCRKCGVKYTNEAPMNDHKCNIYSCPLCDRSFYFLRFLRRHLALHNAAPAYPCPDCDKTFRTPRYLATHKLVHSKEKPYICQVCSAAFSRRDKLSRHALTHNGSKQFKCPFYNEGCLKEYNRKDKLNKHISLVHKMSKS